MKRHLKFAVFGDIHGRIPLMYTLAMLWQQHSGCELDGLLQVGDMGAFPDLSKLDAATKKHASKDADELGFANFCKVTPESKFYLQDLPSPPTYFVRGNHEDFDYLNTFAQPTPIDPWGKIHFIPDSHTIEVDRVKIAAFGGIASRYEEVGRGKIARTLARKAKQKTQTEPRFFSTTQLEDINPNCYAVDILMTHAGARSAALPTGSIFLDRLVDRIRPRVHLFGHHHCVIYRDDRVTNCLTIGLEHLEFSDRDAKLKQGSWGILTIDGDSVAFEFVSSDTFPLLAQLDRRNYRHLLTRSINN